MSDTKDAARRSFIRMLLANAPQMNILQLCRLLDAHDPTHPRLGTLDTLLHEPMRFRPYAPMGFPAAEVASVAYNHECPNAPPTVRTTFLGLYGVDAVLPPYLIDDIVLRREGSEKVMAFLDIFNHRIITLFYRAWRKYHYPVSFLPGAQDEISHYLFCLAGLGIGRAADKSGLAPSRLLGVLARLAQRTRPAEGLIGVMRHLLEGAQVTVEPWHSIWIAVDLPQRLSSARPQVRMPQAFSLGLGEGHVLGRRILDRTQAVLVTICPRDVTQAHALLPGENLHQDVMRFVGVYLGLKVDAILRLTIPASYVPAMSLISGVATAYCPRQYRPRLGWTSLLKPMLDQLVTIKLGRWDALNTCYQGVQSE